MYNKENSTKVENYGPVSASTTYSIKDLWTFDAKTSEYINQFLSHFLCGYREIFSNQTALVWLIEK